MKRLWFLAATLSSVLFSTAALAEEASVEKGQTKAVACAACHGANGNSVNPEWPSLAGLGADYISEQLHNFRAGKRVNAIMQGMAMALQEQDIPDVAAYFNSLPNTGLEAEPTYWEAGQKLYRAGDATRGIPACMACHGPTGYGNGPAKFPALRGQQPQYVVKQLTEYASGARGTGPNGIMQTIAKHLTPDDMRNVSTFVAGLR